MEVRHASGLNSSSFLGHVLINIAKDIELILSLGVIRGACLPFSKPPSPILRFLETLFCAGGLLTARKIFQRLRSGPPELCFGCTYFYSAAL